MSDRHRRRPWAPTNAYARRGSMMLARKLLLGIVVTTAVVMALAAWIERRGLDTLMDLDQPHENRLAIVLKNMVTMIWQDRGLDTARDVVRVVDIAIPDIPITWIDLKALDASGMHGLVDQIQTAHERNDFVHATVVGDEGMPVRLTFVPVG